MQLVSVMDFQLEPRQPPVSLTNKRFLVVEDEVDIANLIKLHLSELNADVTAVHDGKEGLTLAMNESWDAIILDLRLPSMDGLDICRELRQQAEHVPIIMVTSRSAELDRVLGLELGADDYLTKPFSVAELKARMKALLRRSQHKKPQVHQGLVKFGHFEIDPTRRVSIVNGQPIELTAKEFDLLYFFASHPNEVFSRSELLDQVWGYGHDGYEHTVNSHINRLRGKLSVSEESDSFIDTVWGVGYRFKVTSR